MKFDIAWMDDAENAVPEERATVAALALHVGGRNATLASLPKGKVVKNITVVAYALAEGLVHDWWRVFTPHDLPVLLRRWRSGYIVPDIRFDFDGQTFTVLVQPSEQGGITFFTKTSEILTSQNAEDQFRNFIDAVDQRLRSKKISGSAMQLRWARVRQSLEDPAETAFCKAAGALGLDPYQIDDASASFIENAEQFFNGEALLEFLAGATTAGKHAELLSWISAAESRPDSTSRLDDLAAHAHSVAVSAPLRSNERPWSLGYRRAQILRSKLDLRGEVGPLSRLATRLGANTAFSDAGSVTGLRAVRSVDGETARIHLRRHGHPAAELFSFARAIGDVICFPANGRASVNDLRNVYRQAASRAFAAEFLAPIDEITELRLKGNDALAMAEKFGVSEEVINHQITNEGQIRAAA